MIPLKTTECANKIENGETIGISFHYYNRKNNSFVSSLMKKILERRNLAYLQDTVMTVLRELIVNAVKANSKRYFFQCNNLDIHNTKHYSNAMEKFKDFIVDNGEGITDRLKENNLKVELYFRKTEASLKVFVRNNTPILPVEMERVRTRIDNAKKYNDFTEVYEDLNDVSEGEGLGLLLTMLFLRNSGIGEQSLHIGSDGKITQTTLTIPSELKPKSITCEIQNRILSEIDSLPALPEHVQQIQALCSETNTPLKSISDKIILDPSLSASVLKLANSAGFITRTKTESVQDGIKVIGMKNLMAILSVSSAKSVMDQKFKSFRQIWDHCNKVAFYARNIAERKRLTKISDKVFLAGMLHDLGKIVLLATSPSLDEWIAEFASKREIRTSTVIEEISIGISHSTIGDMISRKWNMPDYVTESIKYHHSPSLYNGEFKQIVSIVYLANEMCDIEHDKSVYHYLESDILDMFGLDGENRFEAFHNEIQSLPYPSIV
jgi:HD-like signal output (HDOD) protein